MRRYIIFLFSFPGLVYKFILQDYFQISIDFLFLQDITEKMKCQRNWEYVCELNSTFCLHSTKTSGPLLIVSHWVSCPFHSGNMTTCAHDVEVSWHLHSLPSLYSIILKCNPCYWLHSPWCVNTLTPLWDLTITPWTLVLSHSSLLQLCSWKTLVYTHNIRFNVSHLFLKRLRLFLQKNCTKTGSKNVTSVILRVSGRKSHFNGPFVSYRNSIYFCCSSVLFSVWCDSQSFRIMLHQENGSIVWGTGMNSADENTHGWESWDRLLSARWPWGFREVVFSAILQPIYSTTAHYLCPIGHPLLKFWLIPKTHYVKGQFTTFAP